MKHPSRQMVNPAAHLRSWGATGSPGVRVFPGRGGYRPWGILACLGILLWLTGCGLGAAPAAPTAIPTAIPSATSLPSAEDSFGVRASWAEMPCRPTVVMRQGWGWLYSGKPESEGRPGTGRFDESMVRLEAGGVALLTRQNSINLPPGSIADIYLDGGGLVTLYAPDQGEAMLKVSDWQDESYVLNLGEGAVYVREKANSVCPLTLHDVTDHRWFSDGGSYVLISRPKVEPDNEAQTFVVSGTLFLVDERRWAIGTFTPLQAGLIQGARVAQIGVDPSQVIVFSNLQKGLDLFGHPQSSKEPANGIRIEAPAPPVQAETSKGLDLSWLWLLLIYIAVAYFAIIYLIELPSLPERLKAARSWRVVAYEITYYLFSPFTILGAIVLGILLKPLYYLAALAAAPGMVLYLASISGSILLKLLRSLTGGWQRLSVRVSRFARQAPDYVQKRHRDSVGALRIRTEQMMTMPMVTEQVFKKPALKMAQKLGMGENVRTVLRAKATGAEDENDRSQAVRALGILDETNELYELACEPAAAPEVRMEAAKTIPAEKSPGLAAQAWGYIAADVEMPVENRIQAATRLAQLVTAQPSVRIQDSRDHLRTAQDILYALAGSPKTPPDQQAEAATALGMYGEKGKALKLLRYLAARQDNPAAARHLAAKGLGQIGRAAEAASFLKVLAEDTSSGDVCLSAVESLKTFSLEAQLIALATNKKFVQGIDLDVRWKAAQGLQDLKLLSQAAECWLEIARQKEVDPDRRIDAARFAGELGRDEARSVLRTLGTDLAEQANGDRLRLKAADTLTSLTWINEARPIYLALFSNSSTDPDIARRAREASRKLLA